MGYALRFDGSQPVDLAAIDTRGDDDIDERRRQRAARRAGRRSSASCRSSSFAAGTNALLIVLQGMDTSGKDGTIRTF